MHCIHVYVQLLHKDAVVRGSDKKANIFMHMCTVLVILRADFKCIYDEMTVVSMSSGGSI